MSDIVERLRRQSVCVHIAMDAGPAADVSDGLTKAADEIARLRAEVQQLKEALHAAHQHHVRVNQSISDRLGAEIERLRATLREIQEDGE